MAPRSIPIVLLVLVAVGIALTGGRAAATDPFDNALVGYDVKLADNGPGVASDLDLSLHFAAPSTLPEPFGGIVHRTPGPWGIAADEEVPDGDRVGQLNIVLDNPLILDPAVCPAGPAPALLLKAPLMDASSDSSAPDYPPFLPEGDHKARWAGHIEYGTTAIPINVLVGPQPDVTSGDKLQIFIGTGDGATGLPMVDEAALDFCFRLSISLGVAGVSGSGVPVAVNPKVPGKYTFVAELTSRPDPTDPHDHAIVLKASVLIKDGGAGYKVDVRDHNPGVATDLLMALSFRPKSQLPQPFGGITHRAPREWWIAPDEEVPDGDGVARLHLRLNVPPTLADVCPAVLPARPSLALSVPLHDASSDSKANDFPPFLPPGQHRARWTGKIGHAPYGIPVNVLVDETAAGGTAMKVFIGHGPYHIYFRPLTKCLALDVALHVAGHSRSGVPVAVNPEAEGTYTFQAHIVTLPKPNGEGKEFDLKADVKIEASPSPEPCLDCPPGDEDSDAIPDESDLCPQEPEDVDKYDAADGCPDSGDDDTDELLNLIELLVASDPGSQDSDNDGCTDGQELSETPGAGGQRDPMDPWDYFNPTEDGYNRSDDIQAVIDHYHLDQGYEGYDTRYDRTYLGPNAWNLGPPNGTIRSTDIEHIVNQYHHDCGPY